MPSMVLIGPAPRLTRIKPIVEFAGKSCELDRGTQRPCRSGLEFFWQFLLAAILGGGAWFYLQRTAPQPASTLTLYGNVDIREVQPAFNASGHITAMLVQEGAAVKKGQLLATLDDTRYAATLAQAKATAAAARVTLLNDEVNYRRYASLARTSAASKQQRDNAKAVLDAAQRVL